MRGPPGQGLQHHEPAVRGGLQGGHQRQEPPGAGRHLQPGEDKGEEEADRIPGPDCTPGILSHLACQIQPRMVRRRADQMTKQLKADYEVVISF